MTAFSGIIPPVVTPLLPNGEVDHTSLDRVIDHLLDAGMDGLFVLGSTGEVTYLTDDERVSVVTAIAARVGKRVPLIVGCMETTAPRVIDQARRMVAAGADAIVATAPFYALNNEKEIAQHFRLIAAAVDVPIFAYDVPVRLGGVKLSPELLVELGREGVIAGVKDSSGNDVAFRRLVALNRAAGSPLRLFTGHETVNELMLLAGADGQVPGFANVDPHGYRRLADACSAGNWEEAARIQEQINAEFEIVFAPRGRGGDGTGVGAFKIAMHLLGIIDHPTQPATLGEFSDEDITAVREVLVATGMLK
ncbi:dihydrodipicolinate synthase family protein [Arachnia propionica]|uniref:Dihydrodipicolinate synthase family protein n=1 Tax=Arachnia propionica TaxID=1750 RepID=A0A3P1WVD5_9ACTN|nr:dihydrodipicolinate synthase family protein [Arachnia propionica]RRD49868.1 dihydrodipicolinate synthase family protein [Arachnia propionica]